MNGTHQLLIYDYVSLLDENVNITKIKGTEAVLRANEEAGREVNAKKTERMFMARYQITGQNYRRNKSRVANTSYG